ncbi:hypothetical protein [Mesorhizobium sp.]|uniref:hypothetical protein n=1 Tax=Mesorhizobium sp. TaxID=1871066 RepID=UPI0025D4B6C2|nr:hypothetical protein [Mesorhizobium sp.]
MLQEANVLPVPVFHTGTKKPAAQESDGAIKAVTEHRVDGLCARFADREKS